jgi:hypothetical protein
MKQVKVRNYVPNVTLTTVLKHRVLLNPQVIELCLHKVFNTVTLSLLIAAADGYHLVMLVAVNP